MVKVLTVIGARPQFVKASVVSRHLATIDGVREVVAHTGQHYDYSMDKIFFDQLNLRNPDYNLGIGPGSHGAQTGRMLEAIEKILLAENPDGVLVYGDTNSTLAGALAASKLHIPIAHVEAGLRSFNRRMPEEINRLLTDHLATLLFAPTPTAVRNLTREGISEKNIYLVGDVMYDAVIYYTEKSEKNSTVLNDLRLRSKEYILTTIHRAENTDDRTRLAAILQGLSAVGIEISVVFPMHPRTHKAVERFHLADYLGKIRVMEPLGYLDMLLLEKHARLIVTDSGGVQKEAYFHKVPCLTLRDETEWVELVQAGWNRVVPPKTGEQIAHAIKSYLSVTMNCENITLYGEGNAGEQIANILFEFLN